MGRAAVVLFLWTLCRQGFPAVHTSDTDCDAPTRNVATACGDLTCYHGDCDVVQGECRCDRGWTGPDCRVCCDVPCVEGQGTCVRPSPRDQPYCQCHPGYGGDLCTDPQPQCVPTNRNPACWGLFCVHGRCDYRQDGEAYCHCDGEWSGTRCDQCHTDPQRATSATSDPTDTVPTPIISAGPTAPPCQPVSDSSGNCFGLPCVNGHCVVSDPDEYGNIRLLCQCQGSWYGPHCDRCCDRYCHDRGTCQYDHSIGQEYCLCDDPTHSRDSDCQNKTQDTPVTTTVVHSVGETGGSTVQDPEAVNTTSLPFYSKSYNATVLPPGPESANATSLPHDPESVNDTSLPRDPESANATSLSTPACSPTHRDHICFGLHCMHGSCAWLPDRSNVYCQCDGDWYGASCDKCDSVTTNISSQTDDPSKKCYLPENATAGETDCYSIPCINGHCVHLDGNTNDTFQFVCDCYQHWYGPSCDQCCERDCNWGRCESDPETGREYCVCHNSSHSSYSNCSQPHTTKSPVTAIHLGRSATYRVAGTPDTPLAFHLTPSCLVSLLDQMPLHLFNFISKDVVC